MAHVQRVSMIGKDTTVIQGTSARQSAQAPAANRELRSRPHRGRRRLVLVLSLVTLVLLGAIGYQGWRIVEAIVKAEQSAVIAWPTREASVGQASLPTPTEAASIATAAEPTATTTAPKPETATAETGAAPTATATIAAQAPTTEPTQRAPEPTATATPPLAQGPGETSHLSVVRDILGAGVESGDPGLAEVWGGRTSLNILIVGVDRRADGGDQNADVLIIAHVDLINKRVAAVSLPRDLLVEIPGIGPDKINGAYNYGVLSDPDSAVSGVAKVRDTIESVFGVPLDGYVLIDFNGFEEVVESVGGVDLDVPYEIVDEEYPTEDYGVETIRFEPGMQHMDGETALKYVRTRHADSDDARRERQYQVLLALFDKGKSVGSVTRADEMIVALGNSVQTSFPLDQQWTLARLGNEIDRADIRLSVLGPPLLESGYTEDGKWVYFADQAAMVAFVQDALKTDTASMAIGNATTDPTADSP
ncbi:MAG: LCP family protein [Thermomicrobiales bacterium]|nr:LCP family protein [Thermomicrobiales bacterium]